MLPPTRVEDSSLPPTRAEGAPQILLRREELAYRAEQLAQRTDPASKRACHLLRLLEINLLKKWEWSPDRRVFQSNVENITRGQVKLADRWADELDSIKDPEDARATLELRATRALEFERASLMKPLVNYIYDVSVQRHCDLNESGAEEPPDELAYVLAWVCTLVLTGLQVTYLLQVATEMGNGATGIWMRDAAMAAAMFYLIVLPLEILFFYVVVPRLLAEHMSKFNDPIKIKEYPYRTILPSSPVYYLCQRHPELRHTPVGERALGRSAKARRLSDDEIVAELKDIYKDTVWVPAAHTRLLLFLLSIFLTFPEDVQALIFEEIFMVAPLISHLAFSRDFVPPFINSEEEDGGRKNASLAAVVALLCTCFVLLLLYLLFRYSDPVLGACGTAVRRALKLCERRYFGY